MRLQDLAFGLIMLAVFAGMQTMLRRSRSLVVAGNDGEQVLRYGALWKARALFAVVVTLVFVVIGIAAQLNPKEKWIPFQIAAAFALAAAFLVSEVFLRRV